jgi:integrase
MRGSLPQKGCRMSRKDHVPTYRKHRQSGQAIVTLPDGMGGRRDVLLGKFGTKASRMEYGRIIAEWEEAGRRLPQQLAATDLTIHELIAAFWDHAEQHYRRPDGTQTSELADFRMSLRPLSHYYGSTAAKSFGPLALKAVRQAMVNGYSHPKHGQQEALCRNVVNQRIGRIRRLFRWAVEQELVPPSVMHGLAAVRGLQRGRSMVRETEPVKPVAEAFVEATLPFLRATVAAMIRLQLVTGMRPGEVVIMRAIDLDMTGKVWLYRPGSDHGPHGEHKTAWRGHSRIVALGPRAQELIKPFLGTDLQAYLFSPRDTLLSLRTDQRASRKTKVQPSQQNRKKRRPRKTPGDRYTVSSYGKAIDTACGRAFPPPEPMTRRQGETLKQWKARLSEEEKEELRRWRREHSWHPNQLRHTKATEIRRECGLDAARVVLGHRSPQITETYAEIDINKAAEVMAKLG